MLVLWICWHVLPCDSIDVISEVVGGERQTVDGYDRYEDDNPITPYLNEKYRTVVACLLWIVAVASATAGVWYIRSAGLIQNMSARNIVKVIAGIILIAAAWVMIHAGLDVYELGRVYAKHLFV